MLNPDHVARALSYTAQTTTPTIIFRISTLHFRRYIAVTWSNPVELRAKNAGAIYETDAGTAWLRIYERSSQQH
eukprot:COSAG02_NODE_43265_length_376_cov_1.000000_1_plen_74_part_00